jgi:hypothetical protein
MGSPLRSIPTGEGHVTGINEIFRSKQTNCDVHICDMC